MPSANSFATLKGLDLSSIQGLVPTYGNFCGPGWTAGTRNPVTLEKLDQTSPITVTMPDGTTRFSVMDSQCKIHDRNYMLAEGKPNERELISQADLQFLTNIKANYANLTAEEKYYASLAIPTFSFKYNIYDKLMLSSTEIKINETIAYLNEKLDLPKEASFIDQNGNVLSRTTDEEGKITISYKTASESISVTMNKDLRLAEASQTISDDSGKITEETQLSVNPTNGISEITHLTNGEVDIKGVIVGSLSQEKLNQFAELSNSDIQQSDWHDDGANEPLSGSDPIASNANATELLGKLKVGFNENSAQEINDWFAEADPIRLQAYHWDKVDKNLQNLWYYGTDSTLAAYDQQSVMEANHIEWNADTGQWNYPDWLPPADMDQFSLDYVNSFEYSLSDIDLGFENAPVNVYDYNPSDGWNGSTSSDSWSNSYIDPLVLKIGKGSVHTTNLQGSNVMFDMAANGQKVRTGWITPDHAFLVRDRNRNGIIDDSSEMFSERTSPNAATGFAALAQLDSNRDGWIDYRDKAYKELRLWTDINVDGMTQKGELHPLSDFGVEYIAVAKPVAKNVYDNGNLILNVNAYHAVYPRGYFSGEIAEVLFNFGDTKPVASIYISDQATAVRTTEGKTLQVLSDKTAQTMNASMSGINLLVGGKGDVLNAGNSQQSLLIGNGGTTMNGNAGSTHFVVNGSGNTVNTGEGSSFIQVNGDTNTINASKGKVDIDVDGSRNKITIGSDDSVDLGGTANTLISTGKGTGNEVVISGQKQVVTLNNADIALQENASVTLSGKNNDITQEGHSTLLGNATGGTLMVWGDDNISTINNAFVGLAKGAELQLTGKNDQIVMAGEGELVLKGSAAGSTVNVYGDGNQVNMTGGAIKMDEGASLDLSGRNNTITMLGDGDLTARDKGQRLEVYGDGNHAAVNGSTIIEHGLADMDVDGNTNSVRTTLQRPDLLKKELDSEIKNEQLMDTLWDKYQKLADVSIAQQWRELMPNPLSSLPEAAIYDTGLDDSLRSNNPLPILSGANNGLIPQSLIASAAINYGARAIS